jgi:hypothetical protein
MQVRCSEHPNICVLKKLRGGERYLSIVDDQIILTGKFLPISAFSFDWKYWRINVETVKCSCHCVTLTWHSIYCVHLVDELDYKPEGRGFDSDGVIEIFHWLNRSGSAVALGSTQHVTEMSTNDIFWGKGGRCLGLTNLPPTWADCL